MPFLLVWMLARFGFILLICRSTVAQSWELLHFLRAQAAGQLLQLSGSKALQQTQLLADKPGWLRARNDRGADSWSEGDLVCRLADAGAPLCRRTPRKTA